MSQLFNKVHADRNIENSRTLRAALSDVISRMKRREHTPTDSEVISDIEASIQFFREQARGWQDMINSGDIGRLGNDANIQIEANQAKEAHLRGYLTSILKGR